MSDEVNLDSYSAPLWIEIDSLNNTETVCPLPSVPVDETITSLRVSQRKFRRSVVNIDLSTARRASDLHAIKNIAAAKENGEAKSKPPRYYTKDMQTRGGDVGQYILGMTEMAVGAGLMVAGVAVEIGSLVQLDKSF